MTPVRRHTAAPSSDEASGTSRWLRRLRRAASLIVTVVAFGALLLVGGLNIASHAGAVEVVVLHGGSMSPTWPLWSVLVATPEPASSAKPGDIVVIQRDGVRVTHRVVQTSTHGLITRGDANKANDPLPYTGATVGLVRAGVPYVGWLTSVLNPVARMLLTAAAAVLVVSTLIPRGQVTPATATAEEGAS
ncbi:MAG: signal peptidase I [Actinobacteria bacterium 69-20]|nr:MAG: signal peptidase I [Actinobacteria bacterium 69-20]